MKIKLAKLRIKGPIRGLGAPDLALLPKQIRHESSWSLAQETTIKSNERSRYRLNFKNERFQNKSAARVGASRKLQASKKE